MTVKIQFGSDTRSAERNIDRMNRKIGRTGQIAQRSSGTASTALRGIAKTAGIVAVAIGSIRSAAAGIGAADQIAALNNRILSLSESAAEAASRFQDITKIAKDQKQSLQGLGTLYNRMQVATDGLGVSQKELAEFTEAFAAAARASGASAQEAANAAIQLSQGLASNLAGDELKTLRESVPRLTKALEDGLGIARGSIKQFAAETAITAREAIPALLSQLDKLREESKRIAPTLSEIKVGFSNAFALASAQVDKTTGSLGGIKTAIIAATGVLDNFRRTLEGGGSIGLALSDAIITGYRKAFAGIIKGVKSGIETIKGLFASIDFSALADTLGSVMAGIARAFVGFLAGIKVGDISGFVNSLKSAAAQFAVTLFNNLKGVADGIDFTRLGLRLADTIINAIREALEVIGDAISDIVSPLRSSIEKNEAARAKKIEAEGESFLNRFLSGLKKSEQARAKALGIPLAGESAPATAGKGGGGGIFQGISKSNLEETFKGAGSVFTPTAGGATAASGSPFQAFIDELKKITDRAAGARSRAGAVGGAVAGAGGKADPAAAAVNLTDATDTAASALSNLANLTGNKAVAAMSDFISTFQSVNTLFSDFASLLSSASAGGGGGGIGGFLSGIFSSGAAAAAGGTVVGGSGLGDIVPAMLEPGEIVIPNRQRDRDALLGGGSSQPIQFIGRVDKETEDTVRRMVMSGQIQNLQDAVQTQNGKAPVFGGA